MSKYLVSVFFLSSFSVASSFVQKLQCLKNINETGSKLSFMTHDSSYFVTGTKDPKKGFLAVNTLNGKVAFVDLENSQGSSIISNSGGTAYFFKKVHLEGKTIRVCAGVGQKSPHGLAAPDNTKAVPIIEAIAPRGADCELNSVNCCKQKVADKDYQLSTATSYSLLELDMNPYILSAIDKLVSDFQKTMPFGPNEVEKISPNTIKQNKLKFKSPIDSCLKSMDDVAVREYLKSIASYIDRLEFSYPGGNHDTSLRKELKINSLRDAVASPKTTKENNQISAPTVSK